MSAGEPSPSRDVPEQTISAIWQAQWLRRDALRTVDGRAVRVVYRGRWTYGLGPDFRDAMLVFDDGPLVRGDIEIHRRAADWTAHGHEHDQRYGAVVLHVTLDPHPVTCRRPDGEVVPHLALAPFLPAPLTQFSPPVAVPLGALGDGPCASHVVETDPKRLRATVRLAGRQRLNQKAMAVEASFTTLSPDQSFIVGLAEALGYTRNRQPFRALAEHLPVAALEALARGLPPATARQRLAALLLGAAGFLEDDAAVGPTLPPSLRRELAQAWAQLRGHWRPAVAPVTWDLARIRPHNHPVRRLLGLAHLLAWRGPDRLVSSLLATLAAPGTRPDAVVAACVAPDWTTGEAARSALIGQDRALEIVVNVVVVHALARAAVTSDEAGARAALDLMERLPAGTISRPARLMLDQFGGSPGLRPMSALEHQGLLHLHARYCIARRCYECPVAATVSAARLG